jgi:hypothetical protein
MANVGKDVGWGAYQAVSIESVSGKGLRRN